MPKVLKNYIILPFSPLVHEIDGESLLLLVEDLEEFNNIVPKAATRLKIKRLIREAKCPSMQVCIAIAQFGLFWFVLMDHSYRMHMLM